MGKAPSTCCDGCGRKLGQPVPAGQVAYCSRCWAKDDGDQRADLEHLQRNDEGWVPGFNREGRP